MDALDVQKLPPCRYRHSRKRILRFPLPLLFGSIPRNERCYFPLVSSTLLTHILFDTDSLRLIRYALSYPLLGMIFDIFDGKVARWRNESSMLGQELDSLADSVSPAL